MESNHGGLEEDFPFQLEDVQVACEFSEVFFCFFSCQTSTFRPSLVVQPPVF